MPWEKFWERKHTRRPLPSLTEAIKQYGNVVQYPVPKYTEVGHCKWCNKSLPHGRTAFCCEECSQLFTKITVWNRGRSAYSIRIMYRDNFTCQRCGEFLAFINSCGVAIPVDDSKYSAAVHHIRPVHLGGGDEPTNLITVCGTCHKEIHRQESTTGILWQPYNKEEESICQKKQQ